MEWIIGFIVLAVVVGIIQDMYDTEELKDKEHENYVLGREIELEEAKFELKKRKKVLREKMQKV